MLGLVQMKIQRGVGSGTITIDTIDPAKSIIFCSSFGGAAQVNAYILSATSISVSASAYWTVIEFGGAV